MVQVAAGLALLAGLHGQPLCDGQADVGIIAERSQRFQRHVAVALHGPLFSLRHKYGSDQSTDRGSFGKTPTTSVRRLISSLRRSMGLVLCNLARCCGGNVM